MGDYTRAKELLLKGYVLTNLKCPKCKSPLFKDPRTETLVCSKCDYIKLSEKYIVEDLKNFVLEEIRKERKDIGKLLRLVKLLYLIKKIENDKVDRDKGS